jgi:hypothetical protein
MSSTAGPLQRTAAERLTARCSLSARATKRRMAVAQAQRAGVRGRAKDDFRRLPAGAAGSRQRAGSRGEGRDRFRGALLCRRLCGYVPEAIQVMGRYVAQFPWHRARHAGADRGRGAAAADHSARGDEPARERRQRGQRRPQHRQHVQQHSERRRPDIEPGRRSMLSGTSLGGIGSSISGGLSSLTSGANAWGFPRGYSATAFPRWRKAQ